MSKGKDKAKGRFKYFEDYPFKDVPKKNGKGMKRKRVYSGDYYAFVIPAEYKKDPRAYRSRIKLTYIGVMLLMTALWLAAGLINSVGLKTFYVVSGYAVCVIPIALILLTLGELAITSGSRYERSFADALGKSMRVETVVAMIAHAVACVAQVIQIVLAMANNSELNMTAEVAVALIMTANVALAWFYLKLQDSIKLEKVNR